MRHIDLLNWQRSSTVKSLSLKWEFFLLRGKKYERKEESKEEKEYWIHEVNSVSNLVLYCTECYYKLPQQVALANYGHMIPSQTER